MVTIVGNVKPEDDYTHPLGPEENFNESVYFNFFDRTQQLGGFIRMGNRANEGHAEMTVIVYQPDGSALFNYKRPQIAHNDGWDAGGLKVEVEAPGERIRTTYEGSVVFLSDPREMRTIRCLQGEPTQAAQAESGAHGSRPDLRSCGRTGRRRFPE